MSDDFEFKECLSAASMVYHPRASSHSGPVVYSMHLCPALLLSMPLSFPCRAAHDCHFVRMRCDSFAPPPHIFQPPSFLLVNTCILHVDWEVASVSRVCVCLGDILTET